jgi:hypothetical protein
LGRHPPTMPQPRFEQSMTSTVSQQFLSVTLWKGGPIALPTMADAVGSVCAALDPLLRLVEAHVMAAARLHADDTTVPVLASGKTDTGRRWIYVRDDRPFGGAGPPAVMFYYSRDRKGEHPQGHLARYGFLAELMAPDAADVLHLLQPVSLRQLFGNVALAAKIAGRRNFHHRIPVDRRVIMRRCRVVRCQHRR